MAYDWKQYVEQDSSVGALHDYWHETADSWMTAEDRRNYRRNFEHSGFMWDRCVEDHAPVFIYEYQGNPVAWYSESSLTGRITAAGAEPLSLN